MPDRTLIRRAHVVSLDPEVGDQRDADILIADGAIDRLAPQYRPDDVYAGNLLGALDALDGGITTLLDWSHISNTPEHSDEAIRALRDAGLRAVYCCGTPNTSVETWWTDSTQPAQDDVRRIRAEQLSSDDGLITMSLAARGPGFCLPEVVEHDWRMARELAIPISVHVGFGPAVHRFEMVKRLHEQGLLGPDTTYIHGNLCDDEELRLRAEEGRLHDDAPPEAPLLTARQVLEFATIEGARACGLDGRIGSLTPGKQADVVLIDVDRPNTWPVIDPVATVVCSADTGNVDTVLVAGRVVKRGGRLVRDDWPRVRAAATASSARLLPHAGVACGHAH